MRRKKFKLIGLEVFGSSCDLMPSFYINMSLTSLHSVCLYLNSKQALNSILIIIIFWWILKTSKVPIEYLVLLKVKILLNPAEYALFFFPLCALLVVVCVVSYWVWEVTSRVSFAFSVMDSSDFWISPILFACDFDKIFWILAALGKPLVHLHNPFQQYLCEHMMSFLYSVSSFFFFCYPSLLSIWLGLQSLFSFSFLLWLLVFKP